MQDIEQLLQKHWGFSEFRALQKPIIESVLQGNDTLALLPTGGGKSICFQLPTLAQEGICLVITPLIALMKDQVQNLQKRQILATAIYSGMSKREIDIALDNCIYGNIKFLYLSPERLKTEIFLERVKKMKVSLIAIDEAHCISEWGYDFRPTYLELVNIREIIPNVPILALTASATPIVQQDIQEKLGFKASKQVFKRSFARKNLSHVVFYEENKNKRVLKILNNVSGTAIIYATTRKTTLLISQFLQQNNISADYYHGGLNNDERSKKQANWLNNKVRVMVCTNAFGMGIDKLDVRVVIHYGLTRSLEAYYQEAGRAGRDEQKSYTVLLYDNKDIEELYESVAKKYPTVEYLKRVYQAMANYLKLAIGSNNLESYDLDIVYFCQTYRLNTVEVYHAFRLLEMENLIQFDERFHQVSKLKIKVDNRTLYAFQLNNPSYDFLIKTLLRLYGAELFADYLLISEKQLGEHIGMPEKNIIFYLKKLHQATIVEYIGQKETPQITFLTPRLNAEKLPISQHKIDALKEQEMEKLQAVLTYIQSEKQCRTIQLCEYFGEKSVEKCGICDHCLQEKKQLLKDDKEYLQKIIEIIQQKGEISMEALVTFFPQVSAEYLVNLCRKLLDEQKICYTDEGNVKGR